MRGQDIKTKADAVIATENVGHLSLFAEARYWKEIDADLLCNGS